MIGIYKITSPSGKIYIGQSVNIEERWKCHKLDIKYKHIKSRLKNSFIKHGFENHTFEILEECDVNLLNERERFYQDEYDVLKENGLNLKLTETEDRNGFYSQELRDKLSESQKKYNLSLTEEEKVTKNKKTSESMKGLGLGRKHTKETKLLLRNLDK